jgi:hypothetical protein
MLEYVSLITDILSMPLTIGNVTMSLGNVLFGVLVLTYGIKFFAEIGDPRYNHSLGLGIDWSGLDFTPHSSPIVPPVHDPESDWGDQGDDVTW